LDPLGHKGPKVIKVILEHKARLDPPGHKACKNLQDPTKLKARKVLPNVKA
jgi:hypothetical protein